MLAPVSTYDVPPERLERWLRRWADQHAPVARTEVHGGRVTFVAADGAEVECDPPFPPLRGRGGVREGFDPEPLLERADVVVVRFGEQYKQWNAAFDAGLAAALGKPLVTLHPEQHDHALKEVDRAALAVAREPEQVVDILRYVLHGLLPAAVTSRP